jgi:N-formylglutamate deformylase
MSQMGKAQKSEINLNHNNTNLSHQEVPFFVSIPHSGEKIPTQTPWLLSLPEEILMSDVDRFVDSLYMPALNRLSIPFEKTEWHRYAVDLNRLPSDVDQDSVVSAIKPSGAHPDGYHWVMTKNEVVLMQQPMSQRSHEELTQLIYEPFHQNIRQIYSQFKTSGFKNRYHLDAHSMPSIGTRMHKDPGEYRADIVVSDCLGKSCSSVYRDIVISAFVVAGFKVGYNWPYVGGRVTEVYGKPDEGQHAIQVEMNRGLYMDEKTKKIKPGFENIQIKIESALLKIKSELANLK